MLVGDMARKQTVSDHMAAIGALGGSAKVPKGVAVLTAAERKERARAAAEARWGTKREKKQAPAKKRAAVKKRPAAKKRKK